MLDQSVPPTSTETRAPRRFPLWGLVPVAALTWWLVGFLPWIVENALMPGWSAPGAGVPSAGAPLGTLAFGALTGGVAAGLLCLVAPPGRRWTAAAFALGGVALALVVVVLLASRTVGGDGFDGDPRVVAGLSAATVLAALVGWFLGACPAFGRPGLGVALGVLSALVPSWLLALVSAAALATRETFLFGPGWTTATSWAGAAVLAVALVTVGLQPPARAAWWPLVVLPAWFVAPVLTAAGYLEVYVRPGGGLPGSLPDALAATWQVFGQSALPAHRPVLPWVVAVVLAVAVALVLARRRRDRAVSPQPAG
ncbi:hypothetical protein ACI78T_12170 [Blastococcus sp. SYSU D00922]